MRRLARHTPCLLVCALSFAPGAARAEESVSPYPPCTKTPTEGDVAAAKGAFQAGNASFNEADYQRAITYWEDAYRRDCTAHINLLNLARAYELHGDKLHAANALETFITRSPGTADENQIRRRIEKLRETEPEPSTVPAPAEAKTEPEPAPPVAVTSAPVDEPRVRGSRSILPLVVAGVGGAVAIGGSIAFVAARSDANAIEEKCGGRNCDEARFPGATEDGNDARSRALLSGWIAGAGGVVLAGGLVWYFVQKPKTESASVSPRGFAARVTPSFGAGFGGVELSGRF